jgi:type I restriction enzyme S subunit
MSSTFRWAVPESWVWVQTAEIADVTGGGTPSAKDPANFTDDGGIAWITPADLTGYKDTYISRGKRNLSDQGYANSSAKLLPTGAVLFTSRAPIGYCAIASNPIATNQGFKSLTLHGGVSAEYARHYLKWSKPFLETLASGTTFLELSGSKLQIAPFPLPPLAEQTRIVAKLDALSARSARARDALARIETLVKRYKQVVLSKAFSGELAPPSTEVAPGKLISAVMAERAALLQGQKLRKSKGTSPSPDRTPVRLKELPRSWCVLSLEEITNPTRLIQYGILKPGSDVENGVPYVKVMNIKGGIVELSKIRRTTADIHANYARSALKKGDLLLTIRGTVGRLAFAPKELDGGNITQDTVRIDVLSSLLNTYVYWFLHSPMAQEYFTLNQKGVAVRGINVGDVRPMEIPCAPLAEQKEIVRRIESTFEKIDKLAAEAKRALALTGKLDEAILAKAFRGELVPQDPSDEPASALLERIKAERAAAPRAKRGRGKGSA